MLDDTRRSLSSFLLTSSMCHYAVLNGNNHGPWFMAHYVYIARYALAPRPDISIWENETDMRDFQHQSRLSTREGKIFLNRLHQVSLLDFHCWHFHCQIFIVVVSLPGFHCQVFIARFSLPNFHCQIFIARFSLPGFLPSNLTYFSRNFSRNAQMPSCSQAYSIG